MALLFVDGFDANDFAQKWTFVTGCNTSTDTRFSTGRSLYIASSLDYSIMSFTASAQLFCGFAFKCNLVATGRFFEIRGDTASTIHLALAFPNATTIELTRGTSTSIATGTLSQPLAWGTYLEISATVADAGGTCVVKANGVTIINFTGDTKNAGTSTNIDGISFGRYAGSTPQMYFDDLYVCNSTGSAPYNTFLGDVRIHTLVPDGAGSSTQMTPSSGANYTTVDELPYSATDYVRGSAGQTDLYTSSNLPAGVGTIFGVQANAIVKKSDAGTLSGRTVIKSGTTTTNGTSISLGTSDATITDIRSLNPDTSAAWTSGDVNAVEVGVGAV